MEVTMLTTTDNPFDPFDQWDDWYRWDFTHGYHTPGLLARIVVNSTDLSEVGQARALLLAINEIVELNVSGVHKKITKTIERPGVTTLADLSS